MSDPRTKRTRCPDCQWDKNLQSVTWLMCSACREARCSTYTHGIQHEKCERDAAAFRARVVETARAVLPSVVAVLASSDPDGTESTPYAFMVAEAFEKKADEYLKDGGGK